MARKKTAVLTLSDSRTNLNRCVLTINWISRRLRLEEMTGGRFYVRGGAPYVTQGKPFVSLPVFHTIRDTGLNGVEANTDAARERVLNEWNLLKQEWRQTLEDTMGRGLSNLRGLIGKSNAWLDATLHPIERRRLQVYLRQMRHRYRSAPGIAYQSTQVKISQELYDQITSGIPRGKRAKFVSYLLEWASASREGRSFALSAVGIEE